MCTALHKRLSQSSSGRRSVGIYARSAKRKDSTYPMATLLGETESVILKIAGGVGGGVAVEVGVDDRVGVGDGVGVRAERGAV